MYILHFSKAKLDIKELIMRYIHIKGSIIMGSVFSRKGVTQKSKVYKRDRVPLECEYINSRFSITCICSVLAFLYVFVTFKDGTNNEMTILHNILARDIFSSLLDTRKSYSTYLQKNNECKKNMREDPVTGV